MLLAISGKIGSGKDTAALMLQYLFSILKEDVEQATYSQYLQDINDSHYKRNATITRFAKYLKMCLSVILQVPLGWLESDAYKNSEVSWLGITVRELLQKFGTAIRNEVDPNFWAKSLLKDCDAKEITIIADLRFLNEAMAVKQASGYLIRIKRNTAQSLQDHISETELDTFDRWDFVIPNYGTLEELFDKCKVIAQQMRDMNTELK